jgi:hypothetical protein
MKLECCCYPIDAPSSSSSTTIVSQLIEKLPEDGDKGVYFDRDGSLFSKGYLRELWAGQLVVSLRAPWWTLFPGYERDVDDICVLTEPPSSAVLLQTTTDFGVITIITSATVKPAEEAASEAAAEGSLSAIGEQDCSSSTRRPPTAPEMSVALFVFLCFLHK